MVIDACRHDSNMLDERKVRYEYPGVATSFNVILKVSVITEKEAPVPTGAEIGPLRMETSNKFESGRKLETEL